MATSRADADGVGDEGAVADLEPPFFFDPPLGFLEEAVFGEAVDLGFIVLGEKYAKSRLKLGEMGLRLWWMGWGRYRGGVEWD